MDGLVQERGNSSALAMELHLSCTKPSIWLCNEVPPPPAAWNMHIVLLCFVLLWLYQLIIMGSYDTFTPILQGCFTATDCPFGTSPPGQNGRLFADDIFRLNEKFCILVKVSLKFVPKDPIRSSDNDSMYWHLVTRFAAYPGCRWVHLTKRSAYYVD